MTEIGDEVMTGFGNKVVVTAMIPNGGWCCMDHNGQTYNLTEEMTHGCRKTGRHFDQITELLHQMKEDSHE